jgi:hypothetical protein
MIFLIKKLLIITLLKFDIIGEFYSMTSAADKSLEGLKGRRKKFYKSTLAGMPKGELEARLNRIDIISCYACHKLFVSDDIVNVRHCQYCRDKVNDAVDQFATGFVGNNRVKNGRDARSRES